MNNKEKVVIVVAAKKKLDMEKVAREANKQQQRWDRYVYMLIDNIKGQTGYQDNHL